jgi:hypothetical protein
MDHDRHRALELAHEAEGGHGALPAQTAAKVIERAEVYLAFLTGPPKPPADIASYHPAVAARLTGNMTNQGMGKEPSDG